MASGSNEELLRELLSRDEEQISVLIFIVDILLDWLAVHSDESMIADIRAKFETFKGRRS